jgi:hypothetical protein
MHKMPTHEQLRTEFDAAIHDLNQLRPKQNLTTGFAAKIGDSVFDAGYRALAACRTDVFVVRQPLWFGRSMLTWEA